MKFKDLLIVSLIVAAAMVIFAFLAEARLPDGAELPTHWNAAGEVDRTQPALQALLLTPTIMMGMSLLFSLVPSLEPLQEKLEESGPALRVAWISSILIMVVVQAMIGLPAWGITLPSSILLAGLGVMFIALGNILPKTRPGFFVGIRTPWTITDTDNWIATHRLGGKLMMASGAAIIIAAFLPIAPEIAIFITLGSVLTAVIVSFIYSWWIWRKRAA